MKRFFVFIFIIIAAVTSLAQSPKLLLDKNGGSLSGFVYDISSGEALIGANVYIKELKYGNSTNPIGYFIISDIPTGAYNLICSYIGYRAETISVTVKTGSQTAVDIKLKPEAVQTEAVVVSADSMRTIEKLYAKPISKIVLSPAQINQIPKFIEADLLRALQTMPGITSLSDFSSALYIRGGTPDQNLYMIDGTDVYNPEHAFGIFSTFNTNAIKKVEVSKGGFGAEYGGRLSSVLNVTNLDGNRNNFEGVFNLSLLSASTTLQMPLGSIGSISGSLRRTYIDQTYAKWIDDVPDYYFYDGNVKAFLDLGQKDKLSISFFSGRDDLDFKLDKNSKDSFGFLYNWGNMTSSINWRHIFNPKLFASFWVMGSSFDSKFDLDAVDLYEKNALTDYTLKASLEYYASNDFSLKFGAEQKIFSELYDQDFTEQRVLVESDRQLSTAYLSAMYKPINKLEMEAGLRLNYFNSDTTFFNIAPRFAIKYRLTDYSSIKFAYGIYQQYLNRLQRFFISSIWTTANKFNPVSSSTHYILGYQQEISAVWEFEVETYYKSYKDIHQFNKYVGTDITPSYYDERNRPVYTSTEDIFMAGDGESFGLEILLRKDVGIITGWLSYSWSKTNYVYDEINQANYYVPRHNRTSIVNAVLNTNIGRLLWYDDYESSTSEWKLGVNFIYASGQPLTIPSSAYYTNLLPDWGDIQNPYGSSNQYNLYPGAINSFTLPDYIRMDLSLTYEKNYETWTLAPYLQIFNTGNRKNTWFIVYDHDEVDGKIIQTIEKANMLPLLPSIGVNIKF
ncbi:MAG: TonB-dependent receptor [Bacteroidota bacterium]